MSLAFKFQSILFISANSSLFGIRDKNYILMIKIKVLAKRKNFVFSKCHFLNEFENKK